MLDAQRSGTEVLRYRLHRRRRAIEVDQAKVDGRLALEEAAAYARCRNGEHARSPLRGRPHCLWCGEVLR